MVLLFELHNEAVSISVNKNLLKNHKFNDAYSDNMTHMIELRCKRDIAKIHSGDA